MIKCAFLLFLFFVPALGGSNGELVKCLLLAVGCAIWFKTSQNWADRRIPLYGLAVLGILLYASLTSPVTTLFESMVGGEFRMDGWFTIALVFCFGWYCFWDVDRTFDEDGEEVSHSMYWLFGMTLSVFVIGCATVRMFYGWYDLSFYVARPLGISAYMAITIPFILAWIIKRDRSAPWSDVVIGVMAIISGVYLSAETGYRSSFVGLVMGSLVALLLLVDRRALKKCLTAGIAILVLAVLVVFLHPDTLDKFARLGSTRFGDGPRGMLAKQAWDHGFYPFGWGLDSQRHLIDRPFNWTEDAMQTGVYDRFHSWPIELTVTAGWAGLIICLIALYLIWRVVLKRCNEWWICGFAGMVIAFLVCSTWNPPTKQHMLLVAIAVAGICVKPAAPIRYGGKSGVIFDLDEVHPWLVRSAAVLVALLFVTLSVGDRMNKYAKRDWSEATGLPHEILSRQAWAAEMYPWCLRDRVMFYYLARKTGTMLEDNGNKILLCQLLRMERRNYGLEAALWIDLKNYEKANQKIMMAQADAKFGKKIWEWGKE